MTLPLMLYSWCRTLTVKYALCVLNGNVLGNW